MGDIGKAHSEAMKALQNAKKSSSISEDVVKDIKETHQRLQETLNNRKEKTMEEMSEVESFKIASPKAQAKKSSSKRIIKWIRRVSITFILYLSFVLVLLLLGYFFSDNKEIRYYANTFSAWFGWQPFDDALAFKSYPLLELIQKESSNPQTQVLASEKDAIETENSILNDDFDVYFRQQICNATFQRYSNVRFGYSILYPSFLVQGKEADNGDGCIFSANDDICLSVAGINNISNESLEDKYNTESKEHKRHNESITYRRLKDNWFVLSGYTSDRRIYYQKTVLYYNHDTEISVFVTAILYHPTKYKNEFDSIIKKVFTKFPGRENK